MSLTTLLLGRRLANREAEGRKLGILEEIPAMGLDGLSSSAYGPEAALTILVGTGAAGLAWIGPLTWVILVLLVLLCCSYWQTIEAYPSNGGSYTVARENLGTNAGLLAASALMLDYMLNVAVGISAGVAALTSAAPGLHPYTLWLCLGILALLTLVNMRGTRETGLVFALPTYAFIASLGAILLWGVIKAALAGGHPQPVMPPPPVSRATEAVTIWLLLRAFASGCTAMTGVEAVSNGVGAFRDPPVRHAHGTLAAIVAVLGLLLVGIAWLAGAYGVMAMDQSKPGYQSVLSQLVGAVYGRGWFYYVTIGSVLAVLCLSANTSFVGFPRLCRLVARDGFLPRAFAIPGRRLVYSVGILFLASGAAILLAAFGGITDRLFPLFAVGAFLSFTLSQAGLVINAIGAVATGAALAIIIAAKFLEGAWITLIIIPAAVQLLRAIRRYYLRLDFHLLHGEGRRLEVAEGQPPAVLIPIRRWDAVAKAALRTALQISPDVTAIHLTDLEGPDAEEHEAALRRQWQHFVEEPARARGLRSPVLVLERSPYRSVVAPLLRAITALRQREPGRSVLIVLPVLVEGRWWETLMHTHRERRLRAALLRDGGPDVAVLSVPWHLADPQPQKILAEEEPSPA
jgi:amino acid transporter